MKSINISILFFLSIFLSFFLSSVFCLSVFLSFFLLLNMIKKEKIPSSFWNLAKKEKNVTFLPKKSAISKQYFSPLLLICIKNVVWRTNQSVLSLFTCKSEIVLHLQMVQIFWHIFRDFSDTWSFFYKFQIRIFFFFWKLKKTLNWTEYK